MSFRFASASSPNVTRPDSNCGSPRFASQARLRALLVRIARIFAVPREPTTRTVSPGLNFMVSPCRGLVSQLRFGIK